MEGTLEEKSAPKKKKRKPCPRCGTFAKTTKLGGRRLCLECLDRCDPIESEPILVATLLSGGAALAARSSAGWIPLFVPIVIGEVAAGVALPGPTRINFAIGAALGWVATLLTVSIRSELADAVVSSRGLPGPGELLRRAGARLGSLTLTYLMTAIVCGLYSLLLVIPGIVRALDLQLAMPIVVLEGTTPNQAMGASTERMRGSRLVAALSSIVAAMPLVVMLAGMVWLAGLGTQVPELVTTLVQVVLHLAIHLLPFVSLALYFKLRWQAAREKLAPSST